MLFLALILNILVVGLAVIVHYEFLYRITRYIPTMHIKHRLRIVFGVIAALLAHTIEIWIFAGAYLLQLQFAGFGSLEGNFNGSLLDCVYFSFTVYATLGFGDIEPLGPIRYLTGVEALTGLVMITWTASFLYYEMQTLWQED